jgi:pSer/pThr/pTyr-binding forkhead associated (FHA) protein
MEVQLVVLEGKHKDCVIPLPETIFLIGRDPQCHLRPHCQGVSQLHCAIAAWAGKVRVRDLRSRNGTFLNGQPIRGEVTAEDGDRLQVGTLVFAFKIRNEEGSPRAAPIKDERDVGWLLESPADSAVLEPASQTCVLPTTTALAENAATRPPGPEKAHHSGPASAAPTPGSKAVSAGQHLRTYFKERQRRPNPAEGPEPPEETR